MFFCAFCRKTTKSGEKRKMIPVAYHRDKIGHPQITREKPACPRCVGKQKFGDERGDH